MKKIVSLITLALILTISLISLSFAQENENSLSNIKLQTGYIWMKLNGSLYEATNNSTTDLGTLGISNSHSIWIALEKNAYNKRTFVGVSYFQLRDSGRVTLTSNVILPDSQNGGVFFNAGTSLSTSYKYSGLDLYYKSFLAPYTPEQGGWYFIGGLRFNDFDATSSDGVRTAHYKVSVPTFYIGLGGDYKIAQGLRTFGYITGYTGSSSKGSGSEFE